MPSHQLARKRSQGRCCYRYQLNIVCRLLQNSDVWGSTMSSIKWIFFVWFILASNIHSHLPHTIDCSEFGDSPILSCWAYDPPKFFRPEIDNVVFANHCRHWHQWLLYWCGMTLDAFDYSIDDSANRSSTLRIDLLSISNLVIIARPGFYCFKYWKMSGNIDRNNRIRCTRNHTPPYMLHSFANFQTYTKSPPWLRVVQLKYASATRWSCRSLLLSAVIHRVGVRPLCKLKMIAGEVTPPNMNCGCSSSSARPGTGPPCLRLNFAINSSMNLRSVIHSENQAYLVQDIHA